MREKERADREAVRGGQAVHSNAGQDEMRIQQRNMNLPPSTPMSTPSFPTIHIPHTDSQTTQPSARGGGATQTFRSSVQSFAVIGAVMGAVYAFLVLPNAAWTSVAGWCAVGLVGGGTVGGVIWVTLKVLKIAIEITVFIIKWAFILGVAYMVLSYLAR